MDPKNPLEDALEKLTNLLDKVEEEMQKPHESKKLSPQIEKMVQDLERQVEAYQVIYLKTIEKADIDEKGLKRKIAHTPHDFTLKDRRFLDRLQKVKADFEKKRSLLRPLVEKAKSKQLTAKEKKRKRKKKFRGLGSRGKWRKL